jgi:uncharacterized protein YbjT (DUF2867 family)/uncharacterized membrane protein YhaH (DUF805 family)
MRVLLTGATGFIGSAILARLMTDGHEVIAVTRSAGASTRRLFPTKWVELDMARATRPRDWLAHLTQIDAIVNCAGVLQDGGADSTDAVHRAGPAALFAACEGSGVRRVVQISALGADPEAATAFMRSKADGDQDLMARDLDWVVLRPAVVVGRAAYGGSALFRALATLPFLPGMSGFGNVQVVQLDDVVETVAFFLRPQAPTRLALDIAGPERMDIATLVATYRRWLGFPPARAIAGAAVMPLLFRIGDAIGWLGWRPPVRGTARRELSRGSVADTEMWTTMTGIRPRSLTDALAVEPASVQERWFANLYLLKAATFIVLAAFWILTGLITLGPGLEGGVRRLHDAGAGEFANPLAVAGALADFAIGLGIAFRRTSRRALWAAFALSAVYLTLGSLIAPALWVDPLGPMTKIVPVMMLTLLALALQEDR